MKSTVENFYDERHRYQFEKSSDVIDPEFFTVLPEIENTLGVNIAPLGVVEKSLVVSLLTSKNKRIVLTGALGSGKTTTIRFVLEYLRQHYLRDKQDDTLNKHVFLGIDFHETHIGAGSKIQTIIKTVEKDLFKQLKRSVKDILNNNNYIDPFIEQIRDTKNNQWEFLFDDFIDKNNIDTNYSKWEKLTMKQKVTKLLSWINSESDDAEKNRLLGYVIRFIGDSIIVVSFDNIDQLGEEVQERILSGIFKFSSIAKARVLVSLRLTTFGWVVEGATYPYDIFEYAGISPMKVVKERIKHASENPNFPAYEKISKTIQEKYLECFNSRKRFLFNKLQEKHSLIRFKSAFNAISGNSIRRGLSLFKRLFVTKAINYNSDYIYEDELTRALLLSDDKRELLISNDEHVTNIYESANDKSNSLLPLKIMQIVYLAWKYRMNITFQILHEHLRYLSNGKWSDEEILKTLDLLIDVRKRLIFVDCTTSYKERNIFSIRNDPIMITYSGRKYVEDLCCNLVYIQEAFAALDWKDDKIIPRQIDCNSIVDRFSFIRKGLLVFLHDESELTKNYKLNVDPDHNIFPFYLMNEVIMRAADSIFNIVQARYQTNIIESERFSLSQEIINWYDLLLRGAMIEIGDYNTNSIELIRVIELYKKEIPLKKRSSIEEKWGGLPRRELISMLKLGH